MSKLILAAALAAVASLTALEAQAARHLVSERVFYPDLDLSTAAGARTLIQRIGETAGQLCAPSHSPVILRPAGAADTARCQAAAIARAVERLHAPTVTAEYDRIRLQSRRMAAAN